MNALPMLLCCLTWVQTGKWTGQRKGQWEGQWEENRKQRTWCLEIHYEERGSEREPENLDHGTRNERPGEIWNGKSKEYWRGDVCLDGDVNVSEGLNQYAEP
ncbi:hypothetical protein K439DRAFT_1618741 [Ramaria rubella]|nr:hypothetical protein K439DRAFT_1618741 [Ramaria rubella]